MPSAPHAPRNKVRFAFVSAGHLAVACLISYWIATYLLSQLFSVTRADDLLGGMWATVATVFVYRTTTDASAAAGVAVGITTTVVMVVAGVSPDQAWLQPMLRVLDTLIGVAVGMAFARLADLRDRRMPHEPIAN